MGQGASKTSILAGGVKAGQTQPLWRSTGTSAANWTSGISAGSNLLTSGNLHREGATTRSPGVVPRLPPPREELSCLRSQSYGAAGLGPGAQ